MPRGAISTNPALQHLELGDVYREHVGSVYALALRLMGECAQAEDLTQDVFVRALRNLHSYRGEGAVGAWLRRIAVHAFLDRRRAAIRAAIDSGSDLATRGVVLQTPRPIGEEQLGAYGMTRTSRAGTT